MIKIEEKIQNIRKLFINDNFLATFYDYSIQSFMDFSNKLNLSNFCCNIRELLRNLLSKVAPDDEVMICDWCRDNYLDEDSKPTKRARFRYFLLKNIDYRCMKNIIEENELSLEKNYANINKRLSKYTHVQENELELSIEEKITIFMEVLELLQSTLNYLKVTKEDSIRVIKNILYDKIYDHINYDATDENLDCLSNNTVVNGINNLDFEIEDYDFENIYISGSAELDVELQYGSQAERNRDDGLEVDTSFNLDFEVIMSVNDFEEAEYTYKSVDTDSFYEN